MCKESEFEEEMEVQEKTNEKTDETTEEGVLDRNSNNSDHEEEKGGRVVYPDEKEDPASYMLREPEVAYGWKKRQGEYTVEDYYALPDDERVELIDGVLYDMASPAVIHQWIAAKLANEFDRYIEDKGGDCVALAGPVDVQLDRDDRTMVVPDVLILCDRDKLKKQVIYGAPDLVVEVLSPSTKKKDRTIKLRKYCLAGVREYWMVDPREKKVEVYIFQAPDILTPPKVYGFEDSIPVGIYGGDCVVDFAKIYRRIQSLYDSGE